MHYLQRRVGSVVRVSPAFRHGEQRVRAASQHVAIRRIERHGYVARLLGASLCALVAAALLLLRLLRLTVGAARRRQTALRLAMLAQHGKEQSLASAHTRQETIHRSFALQCACYVPFRFDGHIHEVGAQLLGYPRHVLLVLMRVERAGRVDEQTTRSQTVPHVADYLALQSPAVLHVLQAPLLACALILAEHTLARAGHVGENGVELYVRLAVVARVVVGYDHVLVTELLQVLAQNLCASAHRLV